MQVIIIFWVWGSFAILSGFSIVMLVSCCCSLKFHIFMRLTIVWLLVWQRLCCWLVPLWWWHVEVIWSIVVCPSNAMVGDVVVSIVSLFSIGGVVDQINIVLVGWHVLHDWACKLMIPVYLHYFMLDIIRPWCCWTRLSDYILVEIISRKGSLCPILDNSFVCPVSPPYGFS